MRSIRKFRELGEKLTNSIWIWKNKFNIWIVISDICNLLPKIVKQYIIQGKLGTNLNKIRVFKGKNMQIFQLRMKNQ